MEKTHYKLYKAGKLWLTCLMTAVSLGIMSANVTAHAAEEPATKVTSQVATTSDAVKNEGTQKAGVKAASEVKQSDKQAADTAQSTDKQAVDAKTADEKKAAQSTTVKTNTTDTHFQELKDQTANSPIDIAAGFHIFAGKVVISADCNGNLAVKEYVSGPEFGTRGDSHNISVDGNDTYYIEQIDQMGANGFRTGNNYVVFGPDAHYEIKNGQVFVNGNRLDHLKASDVHQSIKAIDIDGELSHLAGVANDLASHTQQGDGIKFDLDRDQNNRSIDVTNAKADDNGLVYVNLDSKYLEAAQPITIKGLSSKDDGATIVINVKAGDTVNWNTQSKLIYDDGTSLNPSESHSKPNHILWNFDHVKNLNITSGYLMGSVLAPNADIKAGANADGNLIGQVVEITGGESHRWDLHTSAKTASDKETPSQPGKTTPDDKEDQSKNSDKTNTPDKGNTGKDTGNKTDSNKPEKGTDKDKPGNPSNPVTPTTPDKDNPEKPDDKQPDYPYGPVTPHGDNNPETEVPGGKTDQNQPGKDTDHKTPDQPSQPENPKTDTDQPSEPDDKKPGTPTTPDQPSKPNDKKPTKPDHQEDKPGKKTADKPQTPVNPDQNQPGKDTDHKTPDQPSQPEKPKTDTDQPSKPDDSKPGTPTTPDQPSKPDDNNPVTPTTPDQPSEPDDSKTETPTTPDQPSNPGKINKSETGKVTPNPSTPVIPFIPNQKPTEPQQPTTPETPVKPVEKGNQDHSDNQLVQPNDQVEIKEDCTVSSNMSTKSLNKKTVNASTTQKALPQTGNHNSTMIAILGFLISLIAPVLVNKS